MEGEPRFVRECDNRADQRTNMFVGALLRGNDFCAPVTIRNMSPKGALLQSVAVPQEGLAVRLVRGSLTVPARVVWATEQRCGIRFSSIICVQDWLGPLGNHEQTRIDETLALLKAGTVPLVAAGRGWAGQERETSQAAPVPEDLVRLGRLIEAVTDELADDEAIVSRHPDMLQSLEIAVQALSAIANSLDGVTDCRVETLRTSCGQALRAAGRA